MSNIFFTSDWHFYHDKEFIWGARGFQDVMAMNEAIIYRHNSIVEPNDTVYVLGDCIFGDYKINASIINKMNGKKFLAIGNHDTNAKIETYKSLGLFEDITMGYRLTEGKMTFILSHYPTLVENFGQKPFSVINLFGHTHQTDTFFEGRYDMYNVGVDAHNCYPVPFEQMRNDILNKKWSK